MTIYEIAAGSLLKKTERGEEFIKRVDKGDNMLLVATNVVDPK